MWRKSWIVGIQNYLWRVVLVRSDRRKKISSGGICFLEPFRLNRFCWRLFAWNFKVQLIFKEFLILEFIKTRNHQPRNKTKHKPNTKRDKCCSNLHSCLSAYRSVTWNHMQDLSISWINTNTRSITSNYNAADNTTHDPRNAMQIINTTSIVNSEAWLFNKFSQFNKAGCRNYAC